MLTEDKKYDWREIVSLIGALILGAVLVYASIGKVLDPVMFVEQIRHEGLEIIFTANTVALIGLALETVLGMALLMGVRTFWVVWPTVGLSAFFIFLTARSYWYVLSGLRDSSYDCGCFGVFMQRTAQEAFWQDITLLGIPLILIFMSSRFKSFEIPPIRTLIALVSGIAICVWAVAFIGMPPTVPVLESEMAAAAAGEEGLDIFEPSAQYSLLVDGAQAGNSSVFESQASLRMLLMADELGSPVILDIRSSRVLEADPGEVLPREGGIMVMPLEPNLQESGEFSVGNGGLTFSLHEKSFSLISK